MSRAARAGASRLRLVTPAPEGQAVDELLAALGQWASARDGEPAAYLEVGDDEVCGDFTLTRSQVTSLAALLRAALARGTR